MNWLDRLDNITLEIETGDGQKFYPKWKDAKKNINYNTEGFDFVGVSGTYVERKEQSGNKFPILLYFEGEDCVEQATRFEYAARDPRPWTIHHPFYDALLVQPLNLEFDNSTYNISKITGIVWETINWKYPLTELNVIVTLIQISSEMNVVAAANYGDKITLDTEIIQPAVLISETINNRYSLLTDIFEKVEILKDLVRKASAAANNILQSPISYIQQIQNLINFPLIIEENITFKINQLINAYNDMKDILLGNNSGNIFDVTYEAVSSAFLSSICTIATDKNVNYDKRNDVFDVITQISDLYNDMIYSYDQQDYEPNPELSLLSDKIKSLAIAELYTIASNSRQQRQVRIDKDNTMVVLAHKYYGSGDNNLNDFINQNSLSLSELLQIQKGRLITYFV